MVKNLPAIQETWIWSLGWEDPLEKKMTTHSSILAWRIPWTEEPGKLQFSSVQSLSHVQLCDPMDCSTPAFPVLHQFLELAQIHVHWGCDTRQPPHPLLSPSPPALNLSQHQGLFQWVSSSHQVTKVLEIQLQQQSSNKSGLTFFRIDWFDLPAVQGTLKSLLQHHSSKASILWHSVFFIIHLSHIHT